MDRPDAEVDRRAVRFALNLTRVFGDRAIALADDQAEAASGEAAKSWAAVGVALRALGEANAHMERALELLDTVGEATASIHLDHAIGTLGLRRGTGWNSSGD